MVGRSRKRILGTKSNISHPQEPQSAYDVANVDTADGTKQTSQERLLSEMFCATTIASKPREDETFGDDRASPIATATTAVAAERRRRMRTSTSSTSSTPPPPHGQE